MTGTEIKPLTWILLNVALKQKWGKLKKIIINCALYIVMNPKGKKSILTGGKNILKC